MTSLLRDTELNAEQHDFVETVRSSSEALLTIINDILATNRQILSRQAESWQMSTRATELPVEALQWLRDGEAFDVAVLDMQMPEMDGLRRRGVSASRLPRPSSHASSP